MPKLKESVKQEMRDALLATWDGPLRDGADPSHILQQCADYAIGLLELPDTKKADWFEPEEKK